MARTPASVPGLIRWSRADDYSAAGDGLRVPSSTADRAEAACKYEPRGGAGTGPIYRASSINGHPALEFDGVVNNTLVEAAGTNTSVPNTGYTLFAVALRAASGGGATPVIISNDVGTNGARVFQLGYANTTNTTPRTVSFTDGTNARVDNHAGTATGRGVYGVITGTVTTTKAETYWNGGSDGGTSSGTTTFTTDRKLHVGYTEVSDTKYPLSGLVAEWCIYDHPLTADERATLHSYAQDRYGITVSDYVAESGTVPAGTAAGTWTYAGAASGRAALAGTATGSWSFAGAAAGSSSRAGAAAGAWSYTGAAAGSSARAGTAAGTWTFAGAATGTAPAVGVSEGTATGTWTFTGAATGATVRAGTATGTTTWVGTAAGTAPVEGVPSGAASGVWAFTGAAVGAHTPAGQATGVWSYTSTAAGLLNPAGSAAGLIAWVGAATGRAPAGARNLTVRVGTPRTRTLTAVGAARTVTAQAEV